MSERVEKFSQALLEVNAQRAATYGHPRDHFKRSMALKAVVAECPHPEARHALEMICDKIARLIHDPFFLDSWIDIAGYAKTGVMVTDGKQLDFLEPKTYKSPEVIIAHPTDPTCAICGAREGDCIHTAWKWDKTIKDNPIIPSHLVQDGRKTTS